MQPRVPEPSPAEPSAADPLAAFHPAVAAWFRRSFAAPTAAQLRAWEALHGSRHVLVAAPTGSGKTLAAFLAAIDALVREGFASGLPDETRVLYVSPLKALSNDIQRNLDGPLTGIRDELRAAGLPDVEIRALVRSGDTSAAERAGMRRRAPHIIVTTPESLYILLTSESGRKMLANVRTVIVDEIHAIAGNKRGTHLALTLERLEALLGSPLRRIGLSATQKPIEEIAQFLLGCGPGAAPGCTIVAQGHLRNLDLALELPSSPLGPVMSGEVWTQIYERLAALARVHRTTIVFVNTRRLVERVARHLTERLGEAGVAAHHGSLSKERRLDAEQRLKRGELKVLVATSSLELGIDVGEVDLVCQIGSTRSIGALLQRVGRAGHAVGGTSKGRLFPLSRDELVECVALLDAVRRGELDRLAIPENALDVLAQELVAEVANGEWPIDGLFSLVRRAYPFRRLPEADFAACIDMLADGFDTRHGRRGALLYRDAINGVVRARKGARLTALTSGGAIPDNADYRVVLEPAALAVGTVNEDFAVESLQGDVFQLGNTSYRILRVERGTVRVAGTSTLDPVLAGRGTGSQRRVVGVGRTPEGADRAWPRVRRRAPGDLRRLPLVARDGRNRRACGRASAAIPGRGSGGARRIADARHDRVRALLRRVRGHPTRDSFSAWQPRQSCLGARAAQALLPQLQLRTAGCGDRGSHRALADACAQLQSGRGHALPALDVRAGRARTGAVHGADVRRALALGRRHRARPAAVSRRQEGSAADRTHEC
jgi:ATP-dependent Lhr-like helicase